MDRNNKSLWVPDTTCRFVHAKQHQNDKSVWVQALIGVFSPCKTATLWQDLQVCMGTRPNLPFCACKTATIGTEIQVSMGSSPHVWFCALKTGTLELKLHASMGPTHDLSFCACKTAWLAPELLVSIGPSPHLWFLHAKECLLDKNNKSLWVPDLSCCFVHAKQHDQEWNT